MAKRRSSVVSPPSDFFPTWASTAQHPISALRWVPPELLEPNGYNPNKVFTPELALLKRSILSIGWVAPTFARVPDDQPLPLTADAAYRKALAELLSPELAQAVAERAASLIAYTPPGAVITDGFHRWGLALKDPDIRRASHGLVPTVFAHLDDLTQMAATVSCNRARGQHGIVKSSQLVQHFKRAGVPEPEIGQRLGMDAEETSRLSDVRTSPERSGKDHYGQGWVPDNPALRKPKGP